MEKDRIYSLPAWRLTKWLVKPGRNVPADIQVALLGGLFGSCRSSSAASSIR